MSLKCMIDKWLHKGQISQEEYDAVIKKLEGHNRQIRADLLKPYDVESIEELVRNSYNKGRKYERDSFNDIVIGLTKEDARRIQKDAIEEYIPKLLAFICKKYNIPLVDMNCTVDDFEQMQKGEENG